MIDNAVELCIELALIFHTSPYEYFGRPIKEVADVYMRTNAVLKKLKSDD